MLYAILSLFGFMPALLQGLIDGLMRIIGAFTGAMPVLALAIALGGCLGTGCAGKNASFDQRQARLAAGLDALRQANFKGQVRFNEGGSPLGLNAATNWSLGPQQMTFAVEGEVDFTQPPRAED